MDTEEPAFEDIDWSNPRQALSPLRSRISDLIEEAEMRVAEALKAGEGNAAELARHRLASAKDARASVNSLEERLVADMARAETRALAEAANRQTAALVNWTKVLAAATLVLAIATVVLVVVTATA